MRSCRKAMVICTADHNADIDALYSRGASYVLKMVKLSAERLADMLEEYAHGMGSGEFSKEAHHVHEHVKDVFHQMQQIDKKGERKGSELMASSSKNKKIQN